MRKAITPYVWATVFLAAAVLVRWLLDAIMGNTLPLVTLFGAVAAAVWLGGYPLAIAIAILGYVACAYLFIQPRGHLGLNSLESVVGFVAYLFTCSLIIGFGEAMRVAQRRASRRRELLRVTLGSIGDGVITTDIEGRVTYLNSAAESLTRWKQQDALGEPLDNVFRIVHEGTRRPVENPATKARREGVVVGLANHTLLIQREGSECPIDDSAAPIRDENGEVSGCVLIFRDVTAQRRLERDKANQLLIARLLASIVQSSDDAIISKSLDGVIQSWNAAAERLFGYTPEQAVGRHISLVIPPERIAEEDHILARLRAGQSVDHFETERLRSDGRRVIVSLTISPIKDEAGKVIGASKIARDVTERKRMEDNLRKLAADLSEADRRKDEFLAMLAHELRNPLAPISNAVQVLRNGGIDREAVHSASEMLERQVRHMARLVDDLLDVSRITRGKIELRQERIELAPILNHAVEAVRALYASMNHELTVTLPLQSVYLYADPTRLAQVLGNLLTNASKFTDKGGHIELTVEREDKQAVVRVKDSGIGIAAEQLPHVFGLFTQVDKSLERSRDGLGIGLTLVKTLVEMHDGTVEAHSGGLGRGSEFVIRLPILAETGKPLPRPTVSDPVRPLGLRILIVDDNEDSAESLATLLKLNGLATNTAYDGLAGIVAVERLRPDAVLLDIGLPKLNGYEVCQRIREQSWGKDIIIIAVTGWGQEEDRHKSKEAGFNAHIVKPVDHHALMKLLASLSSGTVPANNPQEHPCELPGS